MMFVTNERFSQVIIASHIIKHTTLANYIMQKLNKETSQLVVTYTSIGSLVVTSIGWLQSAKTWIISSNKHWMASERQNMNKILLPLHH